MTQPLDPGTAASCPDTPSTRRLEIIAGILLALIVLLNLKRYIGINHDAALYLAMALRDRWPNIFNQDMIFAAGSQSSQSSYTLLPWLVNHAFDWTTPGLLFLIGGLLGLLAFTAAAWYFTSALLPQRQRYWAFLGALSLPSAYGVVKIFSYAEPFLTPRPLAEALCLVGAGLLIRKRHSSGIVCLAATGAMHPLQALGAGLVIWPWLVTQDKRWLHVLWLGLPVLLLAGAGVAPFSGLFQTFDPQWLTIVQSYTSQLFLTSWQSMDYNVLSLDAVMLAMAWKTLPKPMAEWCSAALAGLLLGLLTTLICADWLHLILPTALQPWRVHWFAHLLAVASVAALLYRDFNTAEPARGLCLGLAFILSRWMPWAWIPLGLLYALWKPALGEHPSKIKSLLGLLFLLGMLSIFGAYASNEWLMFGTAHHRLELYAFDRRLLIFPLLALGLPLLGVHVWGRSGAKLRIALLLALLTPLLAISARRWDARSPVATLIESGKLGPDMFGVSLPAHAQVFWPNDAYPSVWLALRRPEFFSLRQAAGAVFNRDMALEVKRHLDRVQLAIQQDLYCQIQPQADQGSCRLDAVALSNACQPGSNQRPDYLVLRFRQPIPHAGSWTFIDPATGQPAMTYWLYSCDRVMASLAAQSAGKSR